jgi:hypothetical protein
VIVVIYALRQVRSIKQQASTLRASHQGQVESVMEQYDRLLADVTNYNAQLVEAMQQGREAAH